MCNNKKYSTIILSAGKSERMGTPKFSLMFDSKNTFLEYITNQYYKFGCEEIIVVVNPEGYIHLSRLDLSLPKIVKFIINEHPEWERFYSLKLGAKGLQKFTPTFISNIDNPFINRNTLNNLSSSSESADYIYPTFNGKGGHPFLISGKVAKNLKNEPEDQLHLKDFLSRYSKLGVEVNDEKVLININTKNDYLKLFSQ